MTTIEAQTTVEAQAEVLKSAPQDVPSQVCGSPDSDYAESPSQPDLELLSPSHQKSSLHEIIVPTSHLVFDCSAPLAAAPVRLTIRVNRRGDNSNPSEEANVENELESPPSPIGLVGLRAMRRNNRVIEPITDQAPPLAVVVSIPDSESQRTALKPTGATICTADALPSEDASDSAPSSPVGLSGLRAMLRPSSAVQVSSLSEPDANIGTESALVADLADGSYSIPGLAPMRDLPDGSYSIGGISRAEETGPPPQEEVSDGRHCVPGLIENSKLPDVSHSTPHTHERAEKWDLSTSSFSVDCSSTASNKPSQQSKSKAVAVELPEVKIKVPKHSDSSQTAAQDRATEGIHCSMTEESVWLSQQKQKRPHCRRSSSRLLDESIPDVPGLSDTPDTSSSVTAMEGEQLRGLLDAARKTLTNPDSELFDHDMWLADPTMLASVRNVRDVRDADASGKDGNQNKNVLPERRATSTRPRSVSAPEGCNTGLGFFSAPVALPGLPTKSKEAPQSCRSTHSDGRQRKASKKKGVVLQPVPEVEPKESPEDPLGLGAAACGVDITALTATTPPPSEARARRVSSTRSGSRAGEEGLSTAQTIRMEAEREASVLMSHLLPPSSPMSSGSPKSPKSALGGMAMHTFPPDFSWNTQPALPGLSAQVKLPSCAELEADPSDFPIQVSSQNLVDSASLGSRTGTLGLIEGSAVSEHYEEQADEMEVQTKESEANLV